MELVTHLQVFPLPSGNTKRSKERKKKRGVRKRGTPLSQPPSCPGQALLPTTFTFSTPALGIQQDAQGASWPLMIKPSPLKSRTGETKASPALGHQTARPRLSCPVILPN